jgi:signal transduction histidine kinase
MPKAGWAAVALAGLTGSLALLGLVPGHRPAEPGVLDSAVVMAIALGCGLTCQRAVGLVAATWLTAAAQTWTHFNPLLTALAFGSWLAGAMLRQRRAVIGQLREAGRAIEAENQGLAEEAVRLERARVARELHDIVAHCVSVMVVQAYAGELLTATDPDAAAQAFDQIADTANQADREIAYLVSLLVDEGSPADRLDPFPSAAFLTGEHLPAAVQSLVASAKATGLDVTLHIVGATDDLQPAAAAAAYRIVQEGITNALKHSRGSPIQVSIASGETVTVEVVNGAARSMPDRLASSGGGHGLQGIRDRVVSLGGNVEAGPEPGIGWRLHAAFPAR